MDDELDPTYWIDEEPDYQAGYEGYRPPNPDEDYD